ncbi:MOSC domain-containing protein [Algibacillus agarilyticus]|uniref:MOSC domain-containing protein n=1 Tax=Algibacillus agarilyticus TaxID=2234133 RepID=UPI000DD06D0C|nr:MOSC N-terminal beta barrel domain-containing protein [Algibacillus agarilyticus]
MSESTMLTVTALYIYPVKSLGGIKLNSAKLTVQGLAYDRRWMVIDHQGCFVTQRTLAQMALIEVDINDEYLILSASGYEDFKVPLTKSFSPTDNVNTEVWRDKVIGFNEGFEAEEWLTRVLGLYHGHPLRLVRFADNQIRQVDKNYLPKPNSTHNLNTQASHTAYADGFPFLLTNTMSLTALNHQLTQQGKQAVSMSRFRSNIVVKGLEAWQENTVTTLVSESADEQRWQFELCKPCERCPITKIDPFTAQVPDKLEPLKTLAAMDTHVPLTGAYFGQNAVLSVGESAVISVGDKFTFS